MDERIERAISAGDFVLTDSGQWFLENHPDRLNGISLEDAFSNALIDRTDIGRERHQKRYLYLCKKLGLKPVDLELPNRQRIGVINPH